MSKTEKFIEKAKIIHGDKYDYSKVKYKNSKKKVIIICKIHGEFNQRCDSHLLGQGCKKCAIIQMADKLKSTKEKFVEKANIIHLNKYDYSNVEYKNCYTKVKIICPIHGMFEQIPSYHLSGCGCQVCSNRLTNKEFVERSIIVHKNKYDYSKTKYISCKHRVIITCPIHGDFEQLPFNHLKGDNCKKCFIDSISKENNYNWKGGISTLKDHLRGKLSKWKLDSIEKCGNKCDISKKEFHVIHHLYSFNKILKEAIDETKIKLYENILLYKEEEIKKLEDVLIRIHNEHPLGVCLTRELHIEFHSIYGYDNTEEQYYEFKENKLKHMLYK